MSLRHPLRYAFRLITGTSMIALVTPAFAQEGPEEEDGTTRYSEIIVTATERSELLVGVPIALSLVSVENPNNKARVLANA